MKVKIYGERNSGTNFLKNLLLVNKLEPYDDIKEGNVIYYWKHGIPDNSIKKRHKNLLEIFIFRRLDEWLVSMFYNPYELEKKNTFHEFLTTPQNILPTDAVDFRTMKILNEDDQDKTIFDIRYYKINKIMEYKKSNNRVIFVSLEYLQNEANCRTFLESLKKKYGIYNMYHLITKIPRHTKTNQKGQNRIYPLNVMDYRETIDKNKNNEIENYINNLTFEL